MSAVPFLPRGVRVKQDAVRGVTVLLGPERALMLDAIGAAILAELDGARDVAAISADLAAKYNAPAEVIGRDVRAFLDGLAEKRLLDWAS